MATSGAPSNETYDFVVVGSGAAGLTGALVASLGGLRTVVLEKTDLIGGTTAVSGGTVWIPNNHHTPEVGVDDSKEDAYAYLEACVGEAGDSAHIPILAEQGREAIQYLEHQAGIRLVPMPGGGGSMDYRPWLPGAKVGGRGLTSPETFLADLGEWAEQLRLVHTSEWTGDTRDYYTQNMHLDPPGLQRPGASLFSPPTGDEPRLPKSVGRGAALIAQLLKACLDNGVEVLLNTQAEELLIDNGAVTGIRVNTDAGSREITSSKGVLMATGGYSHEKTLRSLWLSRKIDHSCELETNSGDGHLMGMAVGAQTAGLGDAWWMPHLPLGTDNAVVNTAGSREDRCLPHTILVNSRGQRFMNESVNYHDVGEHFDSLVGGSRSNFPAWLLFDQQGAEKYAMLAWKVIPEGEEAPDWSRSGQTIEELAEAMGVDPVTLAGTVERFNGFAASGVDEDFHRGETLWDRSWGDPANTPNPSLGALEKGPFHAVRMYAGTISTRGGLRVDDRGRVYSASTRSPIEGLYAAGNCSNGGPASSYPGPGATLGAAMTFAYAIGRQVSES